MDFLMNMISGSAAVRDHSPKTFFVALLLMGSVFSFGQSPEGNPPALTLAKADSLFASRQYTQAFEHYYAIRQQGHWSPAMLLKMAYIQEGLGRMGESLYYLNLYTLASHDPQAVKKMAELAQKKRLEGYEEEAMEPLATALREHYLLLAGSLAALSVFLLALMTDQYRKKKTPSRLLAGTLVLSLAVLFIHVTYSRANPRAIVTRNNTYLMTGPSAAASVAEIIGEGHQVRILERKDVWLKVSWKDREVYVRDFLVRKVEL